jgi:hypothetical protein
MSLSLKKLHEQQAGRQQYDEAPRDPQGALFRPGGTGQGYGSGGVTQQS